MDGRALNADIIYYMFDSANMSRWNDHLRTLDLTELDKQSHKAMIAWLISKAETDAGRPVDWRVIIEHNLFSFLKRIALTDLKPQVYHRIVKEKKDEVNRYVLRFFDANIPSMEPGFKARFSEYLASSEDSHEDQIISAAHYLSTKWEFYTIYPVNGSVYDIEGTKASIDRQVGQYRHLAGVDEIDERGSDFSKFVNILGQLRFQQRWIRTPRMPKTTVLGHSLMVANMVYLNDLDKGVDGEQIYWDYYSALFHDLPEVMTKDVITPVKTAVDGLPDLLEGIEHEMVEKEILALIPNAWAEDLATMSFEPFSDMSVPPRNGLQIKACDVLGAWMEAYLSIQYGVTSRTLREGVEGVENRLRNNPALEQSIGAMGIIEDFRRKEI